MDVSEGYKSFEPGQGIVNRVRHLKDSYWDWVDKPEGGSPLFFSNPLLEPLTKTPWWIVPIVWLPLFTSTLIHSVLRLHLDVFDACACVMYGIVAWQFLEYLIHRFIFHARSRSGWGITLHFLFHGCHHKFPGDSLRLVFPPVPASLLVFAVYAALHRLLPEAQAFALFSGMGFGYVAYDCVHHHIHHSPCDGNFILRELRLRHFRHHHVDSTKGFGISSVFFDALLGTRDSLPDK